MHEIAIVGGGLCGLALAHSLHARRRDWCLFEARERLGGRVLTVAGPQGQALDLGATWVWPTRQPMIGRLIHDLGLDTLAQADDGRLLHLREAGRPAETVAFDAHRLAPGAAGDPATPGALHGGARRLTAGAGALIDALAAPLPASRLRLGHALLGLADRGDHVELQLRRGDQRQVVTARRVVLALPPRLTEAGLHFAPALSPELLATLRATPTWMATAAKAVHAYRRAFWRDAGQSGNAWVTHPQAMLAETWDAGPADAAQGAALAGFAALDAERRSLFARGRELLIDSQLAQIYGDAAQDEAELLARHWQDWAEAPETCSPADRVDDAGAGPGHPPDYGAPLLAQPHWDGRLWFGGSETARQGGGYLEGALAAAGRLRLGLMQSITAEAGKPPVQPA